MRAIAQSRASATRRALWRTHSIALELIAVVQVLLLLGAGLRLARQSPPPYDVDLTALEPQTPLQLIGFHAVERNEAFSYRWSSDYSFVQLPHGYNAASGYIASIRLRSGNPQGPQPLTFLANERALATVTPNATFRTYHVVLPARPDGETSLRFAIETVPFSPPGDVRKLGALTSRFTLQPIPAVEWPVILLLPIALLALWAWLRWRASSAGPALLILTCLAAALLALYQLYRPAPLAYPLLAGLALLGAAAAALPAQETASRLALALLAALVSFSGMLWPSWLTDDAFISFRYAQNLVAGNGLVYNVGERVEGYTNFLWTMLAALALWLGGDPVFLSYVAGVILALAILLLTYWQARRLLGPGWALVAALLVATSQSLLVYTARGAGLETGLFTLLVLAASILYLHPRQRYWSGLVFALATLTRPEGALLMGLTLLYHWFAPQIRVRPGGNTQAVSQHQETKTQRHKELFVFVSSRLRGFVLDLRRGLGLPMLGAYLLIVVPFFLWRFAYYGDLLPNTFYAKTGGGLLQVVRGLTYAGSFALAFGGPLLLALALPFIDNWRAAVASWRGYLVLLIGVYSAYVVAIGGDHFPGERFFVPLVPWLALTVADGLAWLYTWLGRRRLARRLAPAALAVLLFAYGAYALLRSGSFDTIISGDDENVWIWRELGWWMADHAAPGESIAALGAGAIPYYSDHTTIDLLGLNDKHIAHTPVENLGAGAAGHEKRDPQYVLDIRRPTYIPRMWDEYFGGENALRARYTPITIRTRYGRALELWKRSP